MTQKPAFLNDITADHRARMLNLKKYYPFFKLTEQNFEQFKQGRYSNLDMGYIVMAVLRFFIEENNFKEKEVTYPEYVAFIGQCLERDFDMHFDGFEEGRTTEDTALQNPVKEIADFVFDKMKNDGRPFEFGYYDPVEKKRRTSRMKLIESAIRNNTVWYSISADAIEFYLDTKEIKDESRISVQQLLLEKMIRSQNFKGGTEVVERINDEVERLKLKKNEVMEILSTDVFAGLELYQDFVDTGMRWFDDEQKLFVKNKELIDAALQRMEPPKMNVRNQVLMGTADVQAGGAGYYRVVDEIYELENQLKVAMNRHGELLRACMDMQKLTDDIVRKNKLSRLRSHFDFRQMLKQMEDQDCTLPLELMVKAMLKPKLSKRFNLENIDDCMRFQAPQFEKAEVVSAVQTEDIVFADELEDARIHHNYGFFIRMILQYMQEHTIFTLSELHQHMREHYGDASERIFGNADYYSFLVHLCQKKEYTLVLGNAAERSGIGRSGVDMPESAGQTGQESFLDAILQEELAKAAAQGVISFAIEMNSGKTLQLSEIVEISDITFRCEQ